MPVRRGSSYSQRVPAKWLPPLAVAAALAAAATALAATPPPAPTPILAGRTNVVHVAAEPGPAIERAVPGRAFARAAEMDAAERWAEAAALYQDAVTEWTEAGRVRPSPALERAVQKAERERQRSMLLASLGTPRGRFEGPGATNPLEEGRLLRAKLMVVRAARGVAPAGLEARARAALEEALRAAGPARAASEAEVRLLLCATRAAAGDRTAARLERAHLTTADRRDLDNALPLALCAAALGEDDEALARLEMYILRPGPHPLDPFTLRDVYLANDWDRLRGQPRFESLFRAALPP
jgi:hypothetical protein